MLAGAKHSSLLWNSFNGNEEKVFEYWTPAEGLFTQAPLFRRKKCNQSSA
jgi:hypothetical protein